MLNMQNKKVIYTCITGDYDTLLEPLEKSVGFDYICFTDNVKAYKKRGESVWKIRKMPKETENIPCDKKQRFVKVCPHKLLGEYDLSVWVDANVTITKDINDFIGLLNTEKFSIYPVCHPQRDCIYDEAIAVIKMNKAKGDVVKEQVVNYMKEGFPKHFGLLQSCILVRCHNKQDCVTFMNDWWLEIRDKCHRDQLSFNYVAWKHPEIELAWIDKTLFNSVWFTWNKYHKINTTHNL